MAKKILTLFIFIVIAQLAGVIGSFFTAPNIETWYASLEKPSFAPPNWLFAPAWITLYTLMGISSFLVWRKRQFPRARSALYFYLGQLLFNVLWSIVFFGMKSPFLGLLVIIVLWLLIIITALKFWKVGRVAGLLFIPYILWVSFAAILNFSIWQLNL